MRTADAAGAHGIIIPKRRAVGLTSTAAKIANGGYRTRESCAGDELGSNG